ncbi:hypothetical protein [Tunturiibacter lichenicola]|uniref:hypothetical protein n=1 Tax=Tunturiibacter lichenicola TaxID=2051959 RepID=UPI003D9BF632
MRLRTVIAVYNNWVSARILVEEISRRAAELPFKGFVNCIDDGSTDEPAGGLAPLASLPNLQVSSGNQPLGCVLILMDTPSTKDQSAQARRRPNLRTRGY